MSRIGVAVVGAGRAGAVHARNLASYVPGAEVRAVVDESVVAAEELSRSVGAPDTGSPDTGAPGSFPTLEEAFERAEIDAVVIATPTFTHRDLALSAAGAGKHVFCEKPMALTTQECEEMISAAQEANVVLQIGFMRRFQREFVEARRRVEAGEIGEPALVKSLTRGPGLPPPWAWSLETSNGMLAEVNSHDFDCVRWLAGSELDRVYAETANLKGPSRGVGEPDFYDNAVVSLRFGSGAVGTIDGTCPADYGYDARVELLGTEGLLVIGDVRGTPILEIRDRETGAVTPTHRTWPERFEQGYLHEIEAFAQCVREGTEPAVGGRDGMAAVRAVQAANLSWREERPVYLKEM